MTRRETYIYPDAIASTSANNDDIFLYEKKRTLPVARKDINILLKEMETDNRGKSVDDDGNSSSSSSSSSDEDEDDDDDTNFRYHNIVLDMNDESSSDNEDEFVAKRKRKRSASVSSSDSSSSSSSSDEDEDEEPLKKREKSERIKILKNRVPVTEFVCDLDDTSCVSDMCKDEAKKKKNLANFTFREPFLPKRLVTKMVHVPFKTVQSAIEYPKIDWEGDGKGTLSYSDLRDTKEKYVALRDVCKMGEGDNQCLSMLAQTEFGKVLKETSSKTSPVTTDEYLKKANCKNNMTHYRVRYGIVPKRYKRVAQIFFKKFVELSKQHPIFCQKKKDLVCRRGKMMKGVQSSLEEKNTQKRAFTVMEVGEGEIELAVRSYWKLETTDLLRYDEDVPRKKTKTLLRYLWSRLPREDSITQGLLEYGSFEDPTKINRHTLMILKIQFARIVAICPKEDVQKWEFFMKVCGVHHYLCAHTYTEMRFETMSYIVRLTDRVKKAKLEHGKIADYYVVAKNVSKMLKRWFATPKKITIDLVNAMNRLLYMATVSFAQYCVDYLMHDTSLEAMHLESFLANMKMMKYEPSNLPEIGNMPASSIKGLLDLLMTSIYSSANALGRDTRRLKVSKKDFPLVFHNFLKFHVASAVVCLISHIGAPIEREDRFEDDDNDEEGEGESDTDFEERKRTFKTANKHVGECNRFADAIDSYAEETFTNIVAPWDAIDGDRRDCRNDDDKDDDGDIEEEEVLWLMKQKTNTAISPSISVSSKRKQKSLPSSTPSVTKKQKLESRTQLYTSSDLKFTEYKPVKISITKCVLCAKEMTIRAYHVVEDILVAGCISCMNELSNFGFSRRVQYRSLVRYRIETKLPSPILFNVIEGGKRILKETTTVKDKVRFSYNRYKRHQKRENIVN
jgi:hypothetical protein